MADLQSKIAPTLHSSLACNGQQKCILVIDDTEGIRDILRILLEEEGYHVVTVTNGQEGLDALIKMQPCIILLDLMMPVMNGWEFAEALKKTNKSNIPIMVITAFAERVGDIKNCGIIEKPIDMGKLLNSIKKWC